MNKSDFGPKIRQLDLLTVCNTVWIVFPYDAQQRCPGLGNCVFSLAQCKSHSTGLKSHCLNTHLLLSFKNRLGSLLCYKNRQSIKPW